MSQARRSSRRVPKPDPRSNHGLRETLDELLRQVRTLVLSARTMTDEDLEYAQTRLQWLVDEVWQLAIEPPQEDS